jgi:hypothetical protein
MSVSLMLEPLKFNLTSKLVEFGKFILYFVVDLLYQKNKEQPPLGVLPL